MPRDAVSRTANVEGTGPVYQSNKQSKSVTVGPGQFIVLNDSASSKMFIKFDCNFLRFFEKVLQLSECQRGDPYRTANRNFVRFAHS